MNYGVPYMGSKNSIARQIVDCLPPAEYFVDLFAGGCAITHAAMTSNGKYKKFIANDIDWRGVTLFRDAIAGKYHDEKRVITREEFHELKDKDAYVALCWSFGNNENTYLWGGINEGAKLRACKMLLADTWQERRVLYSDFVRYITSKEEETSNQDELLENKSVLESANRLYELQRLQRLQSLESLESLQRLQRLQSLESLQSLQSLESNCNLSISVSSYDEVNIPKNACVYCDIPYKGTAEYSTTFDHETFYNWVRNQNRPIYISEYTMPDDFKVIWAQKKMVTLQSGSVNKAVEKLFVHESQFDKVHKTDLFGFEDL